jgi:cell division protein FtsN
MAWGLPLIIAVMKIKIILILIASPFFVAFAGDQNDSLHQVQAQAAAADSMGHQGSAATDSIAHAVTELDSHPRPIITSLSQVPEGESGSSYNRANREKATFLVCAGRYYQRANAERHLEALQKLGYSPKLKYDGQEEYWVVLKTVKGNSRAEKIKTQFEKSGITCFLEED